MPSLDLFPDEIIRQILLFIPPEENFTSIQRVSVRLHHLAGDSLLWRYHCRTSFKFWAPQHEFKQKLALRASSVPWRDLWIERTKGNKRNAVLLNEILAHKVGRLQRIGEIAQQGYDAKDFLLRQCQTDNSAPDVLARRYYAHSALGSIHRSLAVEEWYKFQTSGPAEVVLERALGAFDMFVAHGEEADMDDIGDMLDAFALQFRKDHPEFNEMTTRQKALAVLQWVRSQNLTGMADPETNYRNIRNCLLGQTLADPEHPSLPIISTAVYCSIAKRLGLNAGCCAFPTHVHAAVSSPEGETLDGKRFSDPYETERMFLDPYGSDEEVFLLDLRLRLMELGWNAVGSADMFLCPSSTTVIVQRTAQNLKASWTRARELTDGTDAAAELKRLRGGDPARNLESILYSAMWAGLLVTSTASLHWDEILEGFLGRFVQDFSEDAWIVERWLIPLYDRFVESHPRGVHRFGWQDARRALGLVHNLDARAPTVSRRYTQELCERVRYRIGQVFVHRRYGYVGIINGWAPDDTKGLPTPHYMSMDETEDASSSDSTESMRTREDRRRRRHTFYTCLKPGVDRHVVAQNNIRITTDASIIPPSLFFLAGKYFKRFDQETCTFVSNIKEFFPDD